MRFFREHRFVLIFLGLLVLCSVMVIRQHNANQSTQAANQSKHVELREAFILLHARGYNDEAARLYQRLLKDLEKLANSDLIEDYQRTLTLVDPAAKQPQNLIWQYHWTVSNELEKREESTLVRARELAK